MKAIRYKLREILEPDHEVFEPANRMSQNSFLLSKLAEEIDEFRASNFTSPEELADIYEVLHAFKNLNQIDGYEVGNIMRFKSEQLGGFLPVTVINEVPGYVMPTHPTLNPPTPPSEATDGK